ncbi:salt tolerance receptor-like cytoplasmic kinase 1 [Triticum dicoccoides]|uniref:salt tolerance receptor-like cytoplasmic kinase 1 n=1 Tax=Triticum dicoccoides TaxID=85692 RepID=UPI00188E4424|nr:salt tolerance receptor-like cytoplasmic kinase 1 [Triticum dicoccoides]
MLLHRHKFPLLCCGCGGDGVATGVGPRGAAINDTNVQQSGGKGGARQLSWAQVEAMTSGFTSAVVGEGGFSTVYLARLAGSGSSQLAAVKVHRSSERLRRAFRQELDALLRVRHPHIVRLLAFCDQRDEGVLVLEFAPNGSLHDHLHGRDGDGSTKAAPAATMPWARRAAVALQVARALEYLHDRCEPQVVHGDVKASNVLLDAAMGARLCDFGSARAGFSASAAVAARPPRAVLGSPGYVDPHYLRSGVLTKKSDVYSLGVLLLELLTGTQPFSDGRLLTSAVAPMIKAGSCSCDDVRRLVDQRLGSRYDAAEAATVATLAAACVGDNPALRPSMADVVRTLEQISTAGRRSDGVTKP